MKGKQRRGEKEKGKTDKREKQGKGEGKKRLGGRCMVRKGSYQHPPTPSAFLHSKNPACILKPHAGDLGRVCLDLHSFFDPQPTSSFS